jgi:hypothetical protein
MKERVSLTRDVYMVQRYKHIYITEMENSNHFDSRANIFFHSPPKTGFSAIDYSLDKISLVKLNFFKDRQLPAT